MRKQTRKIKFLNLKATKNGHLIKTIIPSKHILKQGKEALSGGIRDNKGYNNLSKGEKISLKELSERSDKIITKTYKGGAVVIMDEKDYVSEAHRQFKNHNEKFNKYPTTANAKLLNHITQRFKQEKLLKEKIADGLKMSNPKPPKVYMERKIHKKDNPV